MQEAEDIDTGVDTRTKEEMLAEQMAGLGSAGKTAAEVAPVTGDILAVKNYPEDISTAKDIISQGLDKGELSSVLGGVALAGLSTVGLLPSVTGVGAGAKIAKKAVKENLKKNLVKEFGDDGASKVVDTVGEASQPIKVTGVKPPKKTVKAYKLFKKDKNGNLYPLFVKMQGNKPLELNTWTKAEAGEINTKTGKVKSSLGDLAYRPGFHGGDLPIATHIGGKKGKVSKPNYRKDNQVWAEVEFGDDTDWQSIADSRALVNKDGTTRVSTAHITDQIPEGGFYRYKTNPNMTGNWLIGGELKINRILTNDEVKSINDAAGVADLPRLSELNMAEGGAVMQKQMEMFEEGGLKDEGGTVDPVSGNDVPPGSTQEEVRDDIPAQLSEGEFVFPADVVRYIGLGNLMRIRQEAKMGLKMMEEMGQMGNSEEATMPDDLPFDINDLDMEDEDEYNTPQEFAVGGMPTPNPNTGVYYNPAAAPTTGVSAVPQQAASQQYVQPVQPQQAAVPTMQVYKPSEVPTFQQTVGDDAFGTYDELRQYKNEAGNIINVPFRNGQPISPIPEGYTFVDPEATETEEVTTTPTTPQTTSVREEPEGDAGVGQGGAFGDMQRMQDRIDLAKKMGVTGMEGVLQGIGGTFGGGYGPEMVGKMTGTGYIIGKDGVLIDPLTMSIQGQPGGAGIVGSIINSITSSGKYDKGAYSKQFYEALPDNIREKLTKENKERLARVEEMLDDPVIEQIIEESGDSGETTGTGGAKAKTFTKKGEQSILDLFKDFSTEGDQTDQTTPDYGGGMQEDYDSGIAGPGNETAGDQTGGGPSQDDAPADSYSGGFNDGPGGAKGMLVNRKKLKSIKKMKRGGLASKK